ncbi:MAG TPA: ParB/RepB/Spo0J family partition protein [Thermomicrobiales bacterium]|jgi:ParB family chromosome partitioning protein|nr:ParB/RepB/Spo0J family partition protein [Thermomicrobiales bacterium]
MADRGAARRRRFTVDSLFTDTRPQAVGVRDLVEAKEIELERIRPDPSQPRQTFDQERLEELADAIRQEGVLQPIVVRYEEGRDVYIVVHGERRWRASKMAGRETIPALVRDIPIERRLIQQLMENIVRDDLNAVDRASALRALKAQLRDAPWETVAEAVGIKRSRLFQLLGTEKLPETARDDIRAGRLSEKQSRALQGLTRPAQEALREAIVEDGIAAEDAQRVSRRLRDEPLPDDPAAISTRVRELLAEPATLQPAEPVPDARRQVAEPDALVEPMAPNPAPLGAPTLPPSSESVPSTPVERVPRPEPSLASVGAAAWRSTLDDLRGDQPLPATYDTEGVQLAIRRLAAALRNAKGDDLRDGPLTRDLMTLRRAIDGALDA